MGASLGSGVPLVLLGGVVFAVAALWIGLRLVVSPMATTALLVAVVVSEVSSVVGYVGPLSIYLVTLALAVVCLALGVRRGEIQLVWSPVFLFALVWLATRAVSLFVATDVPAGTSLLVEEAKDLVMLFVTTTLLASLPRMHRVVGLAVGTIAAVAALTVVQEFVLHDSTTFGGFSNIMVASEVSSLGARHSGSDVDPNFWGRMLLLYLPLSLALWRARVGARWRWLWLVAAVSLLGGEYLSQSRGGLVAMAVTLVVWFLLVARDRLKVLAVVVALAAVALAVPGVGSRLGTLGSLGSTSATAPVDPSLAGREQAQTAGIAMFKDHPLLGVGIANFEAAGDVYSRRLGLNALAAIRGQRAAHDIYIEMLSEGGLIGLAGWLLLYFGSLAVALRARRLWRLVDADERSRASNLSAAVVAGLIGWGVASVFLHLSNFTVLLVIVASSAVLDLRARRYAADIGVAVPSALQGLIPRATLLRPRSVRRRPGRAVPVLRVLGVVLVAGAVGAGYLAVTAPTVWRGTLTATAIPPNRLGTAYAYDVLSRDAIVPTLLLVATNHQNVATAEGRLGLAVGPQTALVGAQRVGSGADFTLTVTSRDRGVAASLAPVVIDSATRYLTGQHSLYVLRSGLRTAPVKVVGFAEPAAAFAALLLLGVLSLAAAQWRRRRPRRDIPALVISADSGRGRQYDHAGST